MREQVISAQLPQFFLNSTALNPTRTIQYFTSGRIARFCSIVHFISRVWASVYTPFKFYLRILILHCLNPKRSGDRDYSHPSPCSESGPQRSSCRASIGMFSPARREGLPQPYKYRHCLSLGASSLGESSATVVRSYRFRTTLRATANLVGKCRYWYQYSQDANPTNTPCPRPSFLLSFLPSFLLLPLLPPSFFLLPPSSFLSRFPSFLPDPPMIQ
ncbi:hypothetical protein HOY82DRAFT_41389 [Tuber indicum]|nr:hypothetical protein HOY82DRAFT_41389 [Tuber indicum]